MVGEACIHPLVSFTFYSRVIVCVFLSMADSDLCNWIYGEDLYLLFCLTFHPPRLSLWIAVCCVTWSLGDHWVYVDKCRLQNLMYLPPLTLVHPYPLLFGNLACLTDSQSDRELSERLFSLENQQCHLFNLVFFLLFVSTFLSIFLKPKTTDRQC